jgi:hypothetical protein
MFEDSADDFVVIMRSLVPSDTIGRSPRQGLVDTGYANSFFRDTTCGPPVVLS